MFFFSPAFSTATWFLRDGFRYRVHFVCSFFYALIRTSNISICSNRPDGKIWSLCHQCQTLSNLEDRPKLFSFWVMEVKKREKSSLFYFCSKNFCFFRNFRYP